MVSNFVRSHPLLAGGTLVGALAAAAVDSRLDPQAWTPPEPPALTGALAPNKELTGAETVVDCDGPEDVAFDDAGRLYTGTEDGIVRRTVDPLDSETDEALEPFAYVGGRPLGLEFVSDDLFVCVAGVGLVRVDSDGNAGVVADRAGGHPIAFADDLYADDGTIYFTDATVHEQYEDELLELRDTGRLLAYHPESGETTVEVTGFGFANGVVPGPENESLLVTETSRYRVTRYWFRGDRAGDVEQIATNLPGFPDNIDVAGDGTYWVAIPNRRDPTIDSLHEHPWLVRQLGKLPAAAVGALDIEPYGLVLRMTADGEIVESLHDPTGEVFGVTSATEHEGALYLGTLFGERVVRYPLAE
jgi:sugar lactone lactonase YvrE